ncbi:MAG: DUF1549 domain-containing protein [Gemmataceae bacterium]
MLLSATRGSVYKRVTVLAACLPVLAGFLLVLERAVWANDEKKPDSATKAPSATSTGSKNWKETVKIIDEQLAKGWTENKVTPSPTCDDYEFIRRATLDIIGRIATPEEIEQFLKDAKDVRREKLVDRLLQSDEYPRYWGTVWTNWLLSRTGVFGRGPYHDWMHTWVETEFASNIPYDAFVKKLITARGKNNDTKDGGAAANFILANLGENVPREEMGAKGGRFEAVPITSRITRLFLGVQTQCTQCHDHPFGKEKQQQFWGVNVFLRQLDRVGQPPMMRQMALAPALELKDNPNFNKDGKVYYEKRNGVVLETGPVFLDGSKLDLKKVNLKPAKDEQPWTRRDGLAEMILEHPNFPKAAVNRMWAHFFGKGFVNPIDDFHEQNQPSNPELLDELGAQFKHYGYDLKTLIRAICNSKTYSMSSVTNKTNSQPAQDTLFSHMMLKSMSPEQLFESLWTATHWEVKLGRSKLTDKQNTEKSTLKNQWLSSLINGFGDDEGNEVNFNGTVVQALMMMNGKDINDAISRKDDGTVARAVVRSKGAFDRTVTDLYLVSLNRKPSQQELSKIRKAMYLTKSGEKDIAAPYQDVFWALLNSNEFLLNH